MSNSLGAYLRPSRLPLPFVSNNSNGHNYYSDPNGQKEPWRKQGSRRRFLIRWCLFPTILLSIFLIWSTTREAFKEPPPPPPIVEVDPFENCAQAIQEAGIPSAENIIKLELATASIAGPDGNVHKVHKSPQAGSEDPRKWAREISATKLMEMLENGEQPGPRILHQSWKEEPLLPHFERWSNKWRRQLDETWLYVPGISGMGLLLIITLRYVLWRDSDNRKLVERYYSKYLNAYDLLPREIYRADMVSSPWCPLPLPLHVPAVGNAPSIHAYSPNSIGS